MKNAILAMTVALGLAQPAQADSDVAKILGGIIIGGVIVDALNDRPRHVENHYYHQPQPVPQPHPAQVCYRDVEYSAQWIYVYERNCWGDVINFTQRPRW